MMPCLNAAISSGLFKSHSASLLKKNQVICYTHERRYTHKKALHKRTHTLSTVCIIRTTCSVQHKMVTAKSNDAAVVCRSV
jgi:hypothetical protein